MPTIELHITGKVQGVYYRANARRKADELGLTGWVRNMPDGSVQLRATGSNDVLARLEQWCTVGPSGAAVTGVFRLDLADEAFSGFTIVR